MLDRLLVIPGTLPGLNEYIAAERTNRYKAAAMKREAESLVLWAGAHGIHVGGAQPPPGQGQHFGIRAENHTGRARQGRISPGRRLGAYIRVFG